MEYSPSLSFGMLPKEKRSFRSIALSVTLNLSMIVVALLLGRAAHRVVQKHLDSVELIFPPTPPPVPMPRPRFHVTVPVLKIEPAKIAMPARPVPTLPRPVKVILPTRAPDLVPQPVTAVHLAPQPKLTNAFNRANVAAPKMHAQVVAASFGVSQVNPNAISSAHVVPVGSVFGSAGGREAGSPVRHVSSLGFGDATEVEHGSAQGQVKSAGFSVRAVKPALATIHSERAQTSTLVITSKPTPQYTDEAKKLKIQGDVVLEVTFTANGRVNILRVVQGLGHGLDEQAEEAAKKIQFKPATKNGEPVAVTTRISILFELA